MWPNRRVMKLTAVSRRVASGLIEKQPSAPRAPPLLAAAERSYAADPPGHGKSTGRRVASVLAARHVARQDLAVCASRGQDEGGLTGSASSKIRPRQSLPRHGLTEGRTGPRPGGRSRTPAATNGDRDACERFAADIPPGWRNRGTPAACCASTQEDVRGNPQGCATVYEGSASDPPEAERKTGHRPRSRDTRQ